MPIVLLFFIAAVCLVFSVVCISEHETKWAAILFTVSLAAAIWMGAADSYKEDVLYEIEPTSTYMVSKIKDGRLINVTDETGRSDIDPEKHMLKVTYGKGFKHGIYWMEIEGLKFDIVEKED